MVAVSEKGGHDSQVHLLEGLDGVERSILIALQVGKLNLHLVLGLNKATARERVDMRVHLSIVSGARGIASLDRRLCDAASEVGHGDGEEGRKM